MGAALNVTEVPRIVSSFRRRGLFEHLDQIWEQDYIAAYSLTRGLGITRGEVLSNGPR